MAPDTAERAGGSGASACSMPRSGAACRAVLLLPGEAILLWPRPGAGDRCGGGRVLAMFALGMPAILMYTATTLFLEGLGRPIPGMLVMAAGQSRQFRPQLAADVRPARARRRRRCARDLAHPLVHARCAGRLRAADAWPRTLPAPRAARGRGGRGEAAPPRLADGAVVRPRARRLLRRGDLRRLARRQRRSPPGRSSSTRWR